MLPSGVTCSISRFWYVLPRAGTGCGPLMMQPFQAACYNGNLKTVPSFPVFGCLLVGQLLIAHVSAGARKPLDVKDHASTINIFKWFS